MPYDEASFLAGVAAGRNMESWPAIDGSEIFRFTVQISPEEVASGYSSPYMFFKGDIFWGDGSVSSFDNVSSLPYPPSPNRRRSRTSHSYPSAGLYQITLKGYLLEWSMSIADYGGISDYTLISVDTPFPHSMVGYTHPYQLHSEFNYARGLISVPDGLYKNVKYTRINHQFYECDSLTSLPRGLFDGCESVTDASSMFVFCDNLDTIPPGLFAGMPNAISIASFFARCPSIHSIPPGLLDPLQKLEDVSGLFNMTGFPLSGAGLKFIPEHLFSNCPNITTFDNSFANNTAMDVFPPPLWDMYPDAISNACFYDCTNIPGYYRIPRDWRGPWP